MTTQAETKPHVLRVRVTDQEKAWLEQHAAADARSVHFILRRALHEYFLNHQDDET